MNPDVKNDISAETERPLAGKKRLLIRLSPNWNEVNEWNVGSEKHRIKNNKTTGTSKRFF
jgi:hypothetical protein